MNKLFINILIVAVAIFARLNYSMEKISLDMHKHIASYVIEARDQKIAEKALQNFEENGLQKNNNGDNVSFCHRAWTALAFTQTKPIKGHYIAVSLAETMALTKQQRAVLSEVYKDRREGDYFMESRYSTHRNILTTLNMTDFQKTILEQCPNHILGVFLGKRNHKNVHSRHAEEMNGQYFPESQEIFVNIYHPLNLEPHINEMLCKLCAGNMYGFVYSTAVALYACVRHIEPYQKCILTNDESGYYFTSFSVEEKIFGCSNPPKLKIVYKNEKSARGHTLY